MIKLKKKVHVVHHTHWDFEWYFTNNESFVQLTYHLDEVMNSLEKGIISFYLLDGQMSILDEYLQCFPEQKSRIKKLVTAKKLYIGPWYTQTDELIIAGESIVRNLELGIELAEELGGYFPVGYLPDSFGQSKDMPKIYNGFGIDKTIFWRGVPNNITTDREFNWQSEDGSKVAAANIKDGYFVGVGLIYSDDASSLMETIDKGSTGENLLLPVGGDQRYVDYDLKTRIASYNNQLTDFELVESTYEKFFDDIDFESLETVEGEFISPSVSKIHRSIYSSRYDHKYLNDKVERRMIYQLEPLMVLAKKAGIEVKQGLVDRIWKVLNKNQAHDSAGGCNSDKTNKIILDRFIEADELSYSAVDYLTRKIAESRPNVKENEVTFFNTIPVTDKKQVRFELALTSEYFTLWQGDSEITYQLIETRKENSGSIKRKPEEMDQSQFYYIHEVLVELELPGQSFVTLQAKTSKNSSPRVSVIEQKNHIENQFYSVTKSNSGLCLIDKVTGDTYQDFLKIEDSGDEGDTYDYSPPYEDFLLALDFSQSQSVVSKGVLEEQLTLTGDWLLPLNLAERESKTLSQKVPYELTITLKKDTNRIECHLNIENKALDHRMRVLIETNIENDVSHTDTPFGTITRPVKDEFLENWRELGWREEPTAIFPMLHYVNAHNSEKSLTVMAKGIKEYQFVGSTFNQIALTLFRSVGFLGRPDLIRRPGIASGNEFKYIPTPDSQLEKSLTFKFAIQLTNNYNPSLIMADYLNYAVSVPFYQIQEINRFTTTLKYFVSNPLLNEVPDIQGPILEGKNVILSSFKQNRQKDGVELRVFNPSQSQVVDNGGYLKLPAETNYEFVNLAGTALTDVFISDRIALGSFAPGQIKTINLKYKE